MDDVEITSDKVSELIRMGVIGRWWCDACDDWILYKTYMAKMVLDGGGKRGRVYGETASKAAHNKERHGG